MPIKAVIFDLDGTITRPWFDFDLIREEMHLPRDSGPILEQMEKMPPEQRRQVDEILSRYEQKAIAESTLNAGARETLQQLAEMGIRIGILTRNRRENAMAVARKHNLRFDAVVGREEGPVKPNAFGVLHLCRQFNVTPDETLVVGDYLFDLLCAKAAGATAVLFDSQNRAEQIGQHADFTIYDLAEIMKIIEQRADRTVFGEA
jgi:HAD superfamily hydrolase (TIGR01509 family)